MRHYLRQRKTADKFGAKIHRMMDGRNSEPTLKREKYYVLKKKLALLIFIDR